jgi:outer membrane biosynthesis protein TonB
MFAIPVSTEPMPARVVADDRDTFWKRLSMVGLVLVLVFFSANGYIQSARNAHLARDAAKEAGATHDDFKAYRHTQKDYNRRLLEALREQNDKLRKAGLPTQPIPEQQPKTASSSQGQAHPSPRPQTSPAPTHRPKPRPSHSPSPKPTHTQKPNPCNDLQYRLTHPLQCLTGANHVAARSTAYVGPSSVLRRAFEELWRACLAFFVHDYRSHT